MRYSFYSCGLACDRPDAGLRCSVRAVAIRRIYYQRFLTVAESWCVITYTDQIRPQRIVTSSTMALPFTVTDNITHRSPSRLLHRPLPRPVQPCELTAPPT